MGGRLVGVATQVMVMAIVASMGILLVGVGVLVLMHVCVVGRAFRRGLAAVGRADSCGGAGGGLTPDDLARLPCFEFGGDGSGRAADCAVCLEGYQPGERCRRLPHCGHSFHQHCVDAWLLRAPVCPMCRAGVDRPKAAPGDGGQVVIGLPAAAEQSPSQ